MVNAKPYCDQRWLDWEYVSWVVAFVSSFFGPDSNVVYVLF